MLVVHHASLVSSCLTHPQETIALYEERLNDAECKRFELEDRIGILETRQLHHSETYAPEPGPQNDSATQIDNESLRDHVHHLQKKIAALEDKLEDVQAGAENEGIVLRDKVKRFKEKEEAMRRELSQGRKEADQALKSEAAVRLRLQEIEEALRENTMALEDARAEVEGLRSELAVSPFGRAPRLPDCIYLCQNAASVVDEGKGYRPDISGVRSGPTKARHLVDESSNVNSPASSYHAMRVLESRNAEVGDKPSLIIHLFAERCTSWRSWQRSFNWNSSRSDKLQLIYGNL
jgi:hypothetical protein